MLGERTPGSAEHLRALQRARELLPQDPGLMSAAARVSIVQRRDAEAYALALAAVRELRYDRTAIEAYAAAASVVGQCREAVRA